MSHLEDLYEKLEIVEEAIHKLDAATTQKVDVTDFPDFCLVVADLVGYSTAYGSDLAPQLRIDASTLNKFAKFRGTVTTQTARALADRVRSYLRSLDQGTPKPRRETSQLPPQDATPPPDPVIPAEEWRFVHIAPGTKTRIAAISALLDTIIVRLAKTNLPPEQQALSQIERAQLIAILETALQILKAPIMEPGMLKKAQEKLKRLADKTVEKQTEAGLGNAASEGARMLWELIKSLF